MRQMQIEQRILATPEAANVILPVSSLQQAESEIRGRYTDEAEFVADLERSGLDRIGLVQAIERELKVEAVLERIASQSVEISDTDVELYYLLHRERFQRPENRTLRHILITINESLPGSDRRSAWTKIEEICTRLKKSPKRFRRTGAETLGMPKRDERRSVGDAQARTLLSGLKSRSAWRPETSRTWSNRRSAFTSSMHCHRGKLRAVLFRSA